MAARSSPVNRPGPLPVLLGADLRVPLVVGFRSATVSSFHVAVTFTPKEPWVNIDPVYIVNDL
jgi:hypothetical protein